MDESVFIPFLNSCSSPPVQHLPYGDPSECISRTRTSPGAEEGQVRRHTSIRQQLSHQSPRNGLRFFTAACKQLLISNFNIARISHECLEAWRPVLDVTRDLTSRLVPNIFLSLSILWVFHGMCQMNCMISYSVFNLILYGENLWKRANSASALLEN